MMTIREAEKLVKSAYSNGNLTEEDKFELTETLTFLIEETHDPEYMMNLGGIYYEDRQFDLALKYYEMAASYDYDVAYECLGYIWYYGRTGERDYKKAFENFSKAAEVGNVVAAYKVADMYKNGYFVDKDYDKYCKTIESLYPRVKDSDWLNDPLPEISMRLARIRKEQGRIEEAIELLLEARPFLAQRIMYNPFFGDLNNMEWLIRDLYELIECDTSDLKLYDLHYVLKSPAKVTFMYKNRKYEIESAEEGGTMAVRFGKKWFRSVQDFFEGSSIGSKKLVTIPFELYDFEVK